MTDTRDINGTELPPAWHLQGKQKIITGEDQGPGLGSSIPRALVLKGSPWLDFLLDLGSTTYGTLHKSLHLALKST